MMSTAFIRAVLMKYPDARVDLIVKSGFESIPLPHRGEILPFDKQSESPYRFGKKLAEIQYDKIFVLPPSFSSALMAFSAGIGKRIGYYGSLRYFLLNKGKSYLQPHRSQHLIREYIQLLDDHVSLLETGPGLEITQEWTQQILGGLQKQLPASYITVAPGVIYGPAKQWPIGHFKEVVKALITKGQKVVVIGTKEDSPLGEALCDVDPTQVYNLCGKTNLNQLIAVLALSDLLISNDSGTMHVMAALQKPQIALFGSTSTTWTGPVNQKATIFDLKYDCSPCFARECKFGHYDCLTQIKPQQVWEQALTILSSPNLSNHQ